jgi:hypothetical protein
MASRPRGNVPRNELRWTIERASVEFGTAQNTLRKSLNQAHIDCGADGCFTTEQICASLFGLMHREKLKTQRELSRRYLLENEITESQVLIRSEVSKGLATIGDAIASRIMADSEMSRSAKEDLLRDLSSIPLVLRQVADGQTRLPRRNGNGTHNGEEVANAG